VRHHFLETLRRPERNQGGSGALRGPPFTLERLEQVEDQLIYRFRKP
jgi:hypothetical protein